MNSLLQCLYNIKEFRNYFIKNKEFFNEKEKPVCKALSKVMMELNNKNEINCDAKEFKEIMGKKNSLFFGNKGGDVKDLFINLIDLILNELLEDKKDESSKYNENSLTELDKKKMFQQIQNEIDQTNIMILLFKVI